MFVIQILFSICIFFFIVIFLIFNYFIYLEKKYENKIYPNVYIDEIEVKGKTINELKKVEEKRNESLKKLNITVLYKNENIATLSAENLNLRSNLKETADHAFLIGRVSLYSAKLYQKITTLLHISKYKFYSQILYDQNTLNELIQNLEDRYNKPAKDALFKFENNRVISFRKEEKGLKILSNNLITDLNKKVAEMKYNPTSKTIYLTDQIINPEITLADANKYGIEELIGEGKSDYTHSIPERIHNLTLAATKFNGVLIPKNKEISFNEIIGDISSLTGYKPAYIIKNGRTVLGDGGGVCQVSTTLFRAALNAGLEITERHAHAYRVGYYENDSKPGFDATVFSPSEDLRIKNDTSAYILIQTEIDNNNNLLIFYLYGKKDERKVEISPLLLYDVQPPPPPLYQDDPTLKKGVIKQIDFPAWGSKTSFDYRVYKQGKIVIEQNFFSLYRPWQAVFLKGTAD